MRHDRCQGWSVVIVAATAAVILLAAVARAQMPVTLQEQLEAQYKVAKMAGGGAVVVEAGTVLVVQRPGIKAMPFRAIPKCPAKFENNTLHMATGFLCTSAIALQDYFQKGDKVYPLKIEVNSAKEKIVFRVVSCDDCNGVNPPTGLKGQVEFEFPNGYLEKASTGDIENTIGQVFAIGNDDQPDQANAQNPGQQAAAMSQQAGDLQQTASQQFTSQQGQTEPQTIQLGMTTDQVQSMLGKPDKFFNVGAKQIYVYKDVKVTFIDRKVNDVQ